MGAPIPDMSHRPSISTPVNVPPRLQPDGGHVRLRAIGDHQYHHRRGDHPLHHQRHHAVLDVGTVYSSPVTISSNTTLQAIAYESGYTNSAVASAVYTLNVPATYTTDTSTAGAWWSSGGGYIYGSMGYVLCAWNNGTDVVSLSGSYVSSVTPVGQSDDLWAGAPKRTRRPSTRRPDTSAAACWFNIPTSPCRSCSIIPMTASRIAWRSTAWIGTKKDESRPSIWKIRPPALPCLAAARSRCRVSAMASGWSSLCYGNVLLKDHRCERGNAVISAIAFDNGSPPTMRRADFHSGGRRLWPRAVGDHQHHHRRGDHQLHHQWHYAEFDGRHGVQQPGEHHRHRHAAGHRL